MPHPRNQCRNCQERQVGCHANCERYSEFRRAIDEDKRLKEAAKTLIPARKLNWKEY